MTLWSTRAFLLMSPVRDPRSPPLLGTDYAACPLCIYLEPRLCTCPVLHMPILMPSGSLGKKGLFCLTLKFLVLNLLPPCPELPNSLHFFSKISIVQTNGSLSYPLGCATLVRHLLRNSSFDKTPFYFQQTLTKH